MSDASHLSSKAAEKLALPDAERIAHIKKPRWIGYPRAQALLDRLEDLLAHPKQPRMPGMLIVGQTNNGKTVLVSRFRDSHPADENPHGEAVRIPVLYIQAPPSPDERGLYNAILNRLFEPYGRSEATDAKRDRVVSILKRVELGMIIIDELQHLLAGPYVRQRTCLNVLKYLGNELCVPIVGIGTEEALHAVNTESQVRNRLEPHALPNWTADDPELPRLLASFERILPLRHPSQLSGKEMAKLIAEMTGGTIGEMSTLLNQAAIHAIRSKTERIDREVLASCGFVNPSLRRTRALVG